MEDALLAITSIAVLLFAGIICSFAASKLKLPQALLLLLTGLAFSQLTFQEKSIIEFHEILLSSASILALSIIAFDSTTRIKIREKDTINNEALKLVFLTTLFSMTLFTASVHYILKIPVWTSIIFSALMIGTSPEALATFKRKTKEITLLKLESAFNTPITVILPFLIIELAGIKSTIPSELIKQTAPVIMNTAIGIGTGIFVAIILFKLIQHMHAETHSHIILITASLLSFVLSENLAGSGVLAAATLGLFIGNAYVKEKITLLETKTALTKTIHILVFMLIGLAVKMQYTRQFMLASATLFLTYISIRFIAVWLSTHNEKFTLTEIMHMTLNAPKGIASAAAMLSLMFIRLEGLQIILQMSLAFIIYSIVLSIITTQLYQKHAPAHRA